MATEYPTLKSISSDVLGGLGLSCACGDVESAFLNRVNSALQMIWSSPLDFHRSEDITIAMAVGTSAYPLDANVQEVLGPVRFATDCAPLAAIASRGEFDDYPVIHLGEPSRKATGRPQAYYADAQRGRDGSGDATPDATQITLRVSPTPTTVEDLLVEVAKEAPRVCADDFGQKGSYSLEVNSFAVGEWLMLESPSGQRVAFTYAADSDGEPARDAVVYDKSVIVDLNGALTVGDAVIALASAIDGVSYFNARADSTEIHIWPACEGVITFEPGTAGLAGDWSEEVAGITSSFIPIPHRYVESLLLPIVRYGMMSGPARMSAGIRAQAPLLESEYHTAIALLGGSDPNRSVMDKTAGRTCDEK